ncbi:Bug family tripartite tricarboxylate transporter substrate binding protein [Aliiruegeria sabulilitoris]|uniref:Bug family tripartite tricarboxylate transporter substrate binding protein n=1 Tax=Aliiruegeria sabulilitoris TaxID=1510458 RepID=UPI000833847E|nr:tripartite tricarboxylate transporter substrate-binding protein [Aliiruegeria sabulilitoris]NDR56187.1 tripartite tricarboxylate transporter substrate binding protein [Pseudoruegeria sp. M32A2M]
MRLWSRTTTLAAMLVSAASLVQAEDFPARTVENIFPWAPGGAMAASQIIAEAMSDELGVSMPVVSTPGAAGTKAFQTAMAKPADGYTVIDGYVAPLVLMPVLGKADWTYEDFTPLYAAVSNAFSIVGRKDETRWDDFEGMMAWGKENPGELRYSTGSRNNLPHMVIAKVLQSYGVVAQNIPYPSDPDSHKDLYAGILDFAFHTPSAYLQNRDQANVLLVLSELPGAKKTYHDAKSIADLDIDLGLSGLAPMGWTWWIVHPDTPADRVEVLSAAMGRALERTEVQEKIANLGFNILGFAPEEYQSVVGPVADQLRAMGDALAWEEEQLKSLN